MLPKLREFYRIYDANVEDKNNISFVIGSSTSTAKELEGDSSLLTLLSLCDGINSLEHISQQLKEKHNLEHDEVIEAIEYLINEQVLEDGTNTSTILSNEELDRYSRHFVYYSSFTDNKYQNQESLKKSTVTLIGMGGIGNWISLNLAAAGVGKLRGVDHDDIELSNLTRQILFTESDVGELKVNKAKERLEALNSNVQFEAIAKKMTGVQSVKDVIQGSDIVILSADSPEHIHYWVDQACYEMKIPWTNVGYLDTWGACGPLTIPDETSCLICEMKTRNVKQDELEKTNEISKINSRAHAPSFGPVNSFISSFAALEVIKFLTSYETPVTIGKRWLINSGTMETEIVDYPKDLECIQCGN